MNDANRHVITLFAELLEAGSPEAQAAYLDRACAGDADLRARLEALLRAHRDAGSFLGGATAAADPVFPAEPPARSEQLGTVIGPYKLLQQLGEGGMGTVYMAEQTHPVRRMVALKIIKPGMDSRHVIARFEAERQALALMDHPNIARVLDAGTTASGRPYFVMELVKGVPITKYCDERRLTPQQRLGLFLPVCQAVQHAHQKGIIHRDLKPSNVLIALYDDKPVPKVIDFGIAKATGQKLTERTMFTEFGQVVGTLEYMSPEQAGLNQLDIDTRSDIYSLGVLLYELLTGTTPLERKRLRDGALLEVLRLIREEEPPKPSTRLSTTDELPSLAANRGLEPKKLSGLLRGELDWIVMKALEKDRDRRYETANGLASDVQRYLADEPVQACPPSTWYRVRKFARRNKAGLMTLAAVLLVGLLAAGGIGWALWDRAAQQEAQRTDLAARRAETEQRVNVALARADQLREQARKMPSATSAEAAAVLVVWRQAEDALAQAAVALSTGAGDDDLRERVTAMHAQLDKGRQHTESRRGRALRKEKLFRDLDEARMALSVWVDDHFDYAAAAAKYAAAFAEYGFAVTPDRIDELARRLGAEETDVRNALLVALDDWADAASRRQTAWSAKDLRALADATDHDAWRKRFRGAVAAGDAATLRDLTAVAPRSSLPSSSLELLARSLIIAGERDEGLALLRWGRGHYPTDFWLPFELGNQLHFGMGATPTPLELEEAIGCYRAALALRPATSAVHNNLGNALHDKKEFDEAVAEFRRAIKLDPKFGYPHANLGNTLHHKGLSDEAIAEYRRAIELDDKGANVYNGFGLALAATNQFDEAIAAYRKAIELNPRYARAHANLGLTLLDKKQVNEALAACRRAIELDPKYATARSYLGIALEAKNQWGAAIAEHRKAVELDPKDAKVHSNLGSALYRNKQLDEAIDCYRKAVELEPKLAQAHDNLGFALHAKNQWDAAVTEHRKAIDLDPKLVSAYVHLGVALHDKKQWDAAIAAYRKAIELDPKSWTPHNNLGNTLVAKKQLDAAIAEFRKAIAVDPGAEKPHYNLGNAMRDKEEWDEAIAEYYKVIELNPKNARAYFALGNALTANNQLDEAIAAYRKTIELDPKNSKAHTNLGAVLQANNQWDEAMAEYRQAIEIDPKDSKAHTNLGTVLQRKGQLDQAIAEFRKAIESDPREATPYYGLGIALQHKNQLAAAIAAYRNAIALQPDYAQAHCNLGLALRSQGQLSASLDSYKRGHSLGSKQKGWHYPSAQWVADAERLVLWEAKLADVLGGKVKAENTREQLGMIEVCRLQRRHVAAARLYADAFAADAKLADNWNAGYRYNAAFHAALAAAGKGTDADKLDETERARWRQQTFKWLRADLDLWNKRPDPRLDLTSPPQRLFPGSAGGR